MNNEIKQKVSPRRVKNHWSKNEKVREMTKNLVSLGLNMTDIASIMGIGRATLFDARNRTPELCAAIEKGRADLHDLLVAQMVLAATGYDYEESRTEREPSGKVRKTITFQKRMPPNAQLFQFLMSNRWPESWKIKKELIRKSAELKATIELEGKAIELFAGKLMEGDETKHADIVPGDNSEPDEAARRCGE